MDDSQFVEESLSDLRNENKPGMDDITRITLSEPYTNRAIIFSI